MYFLFLPSFLPLFFFFLLSIFFSLFLPYLSYLLHPFPSSLLSPLPLSFMVSFDFFLCDVAFPLSFSPSLLCLLISLSPLSLPFFLHYLSWLHWHFISSLFLFLPATPPPPFLPSSPSYLFIHLLPLFHRSFLLLRNISSYSYLSLFFLPLPLFLFPIVLSLLLIDVMLLFFLYINITSVLSIRKPRSCVPKQHSYSLRKVASVTQSFRNTLDPVSRSEEAVGEKDLSSFILLFSVEPK